MRECPFFDNFWFDFVSDCKLLYLKKIGFVEEVCFNRLQVFLIWSVNRCVWMLTRDVSCSLQCFFGWSDLWIFVFKSWNLPQSHSMKLKLTTTKKKEACVLKCAILYKKHAELLVMRTQSRCLPPFICSDRVPHCNNLHKRKTQVTGVCVFYQMRLTPQTHLYICWSISFLWMSCSLNILMQESILSLPSCRPTSGRHNRWSGCILCI